MESEGRGEGRERNLVRRIVGDGCAATGLGLIGAAGGAARRKRRTGASIVSEPRSRTRTAGAPPGGKHPRASTDQGSICPRWTLVWARVDAPK